MYHIFAGRPGENGKATILRGNQGYGIVLIEHKLCCREVPCAAILTGVLYFRFDADNRFGNYYFFDALAFSRACYFSTKGEQLMAVVYYGGAINSGKAGNTFN